MAPEQINQDIEVILYTGEKGQLHLARFRWRDMVFKNDRTINVNKQGAVYFYTVQCHSGDIAQIELDFNRRKWTLISMQAAPPGAFH